MNTDASSNSSRNPLAPNHRNRNDQGAALAQAVSEQHWTRFTDHAHDLGFVGLAAAPNHHISCGDRIRDWVRQGYHGSMEWYSRAVEKRLNLNLVLEDAASVVVLITPYEKEPCKLAGKHLARYACGDDYHDVLKKKLWQLIQGLVEPYPHAHFRPYVDTGPLLERYWAAQAGLGWIGKNGNLINRTLGSYIFISCIVTNLVLPYGVETSGHCGSCTACIEACPTHAIVADGLVDSRKCISYLNIEHRGSFERPPDFSDWLFGCDICQEVCPWTIKFAQEEVIEPFRARPGYASLSEQDIQTMEQAQFSRLFSKSAIKRAKLAGLKRNMDHLLN